MTDEDTLMKRRRGGRETEQAGDRRRPTRPQAGPGDRRANGEAKERKEV